MISSDVSSPPSQQRSHQRLTGTTQPSSARADLLSTGRYVDRISASAVWGTMNRVLFATETDQAEEDLRKILSTSTPEGKHKDDINRFKSLWADVTAPDEITGESPSKQEMEGRWRSRLHTGVDFTRDLKRLREGTLPHDPGTSAARSDSQPGSWISKTWSGSSSSESGSGMPLSQKQEIWRKALPKHQASAPSSRSAESLTAHSQPMRYIDNATAH